MRQMWSMAVLANLALLSTATAAPPPSVPSPPGATSRPPPSLPRTAASPAVTVATRRTLARHELDAVLRAGPQAFIRGVDVRPALVRGRFRGWILVSFQPNDPRYHGVDLRPSDVVTRVNGLPIERPEQFMKVWEGLRSMRVLVVDYLRAGRPRQLSYVVVD